MNRPVRNQETYYDGHHHVHCFGFLLAVDGIDGCCRYFNGHLPGSQNDLNNYYSSDLYHEPGLFLGPGDKVIADGIFARVNEEDNKLIVPVCEVRRPLTVVENNYNLLHRQARSIVEHYNGRLKGSCGILDHYTFSIDKINPHFICCLCLTNIRVKHQDRLRDR